MVEIGHPWWWYQVAKSKDGRGNPIKVERFPTGVKLSTLPFIR